MTGAAQRHGGAEAEPSVSLAGLCREAIAKIKRARQEPPVKLSEDVDEAERLVVRLRNELIDRLRRQGAAATSARTREALNVVNMALSLIVGVEYPVAGLQRKLLEQAGGALRALLDQGLLDEAAPARAP